MVDTKQDVGTEPSTKGLRPGALGMATSVILATASAAPAYSLAATLTFIVGYVGYQAPAIVVLAFVPILFVSFGYAALNRADPDCGTIFTWATRVLGPRTGFLGGWAIIASFVLVMGSLAQVAGQYVFLLFGADKIGSDASHPLVLVVGLAWIALMTAVCYRGIEVAAAVQRALLFVEFGMLVVFSTVALVRVYAGHGVGAHPSMSWLNPFEVPSPNAFVSAVVMMLFIYWGWETAMTVTEETTDSRRIPGRAAIISTVLLLALYLFATVSTLAYAGTGTTGIGLNNAENSGDVFSAVGGAVFGTSGLGSVAFHLMVLMVLTSAAASTETTVLTLGRTMLSMASFGALPKAFGRVHPRFSIPQVGTLATGIAGGLFYVVMNFLADGQVIGDAVSSCGLMIALYYGLTGVTSAWAYRGTLAATGAGTFTKRCVLPGVGGVILFAAGLWSLRNDWNVDSSYTSLTLPGGHQVGGVFVIGVLALLVGVVLMALQRRSSPEFFTRGLSPLDVQEHS